MTATFKSFGIEFLYPENWELSQDEDTRFPRTVSVHSPSGSFWSVSIYPESIPPEKVTADFIQGLRDEYEDVEIEVVETDEQISDDLDVESSFELNFYCLDLLITLKILGFRFDEFTMLIHYQGESRDFDANQTVFSAITQSLLGTD